MIWSRRKALGAMLLVPAEAMAATCGIVTPRQTERPFFKPQSPQRRKLSEAATLVVAGQVLGPDCKPVPNALLDFWHADENGEYDNRGFRYRGHQFADAQGRYRLETIVPAEYPGRARHIHVKVQPPGGPLLTTQLCFPGEPGNRRDSLFRPELAMKMTGGGKGEFDFVLA